MRQEKRNKEGRIQTRKERKRKVKVKTALKILLSAHALTLQADILHLDQEAAKCMICKWLCGKVSLLQA